VEGTQVPVRYDPFNVGIVYAYVRGQWVRCLSQYYATFQGHSEKELAMTTALLRQQARLQHQAAVITPRRLADFLVRVQAHERVLRQGWRDPEAGGVLACLSAGGEARDPETPEATAPTSESWEPVDLARVPVYEEYR